MRAALVAGLVYAEDSEVTRRAPLQKREQLHRDEGHKQHDDGAEVDAEPPRRVLGSSRRKSPM
jgi:hypothetical protein